MQRNWEEQDEKAINSALSFILETIARLEKLHKMTSFRKETAKKGKEIV